MMYKGKNFSYYKGVVSEENSPYAIFCFEFNPFTPPGYQFG